MALSAAQRKRKQVERERAEARIHGEGDEFIRRPFSEVAPWEDIRMHLKEIGVTAPPDYEEDGDYDLEWDAEEIDGPYRHSLGRAERMIDTFHAMGLILAGSVNAFKAQEFGRRIHEIEAADFSDPATKKQALADIAKLTKLLDQLKKRTRFDVPVYRLRG